MAGPAFTGSARSTAPSARCRRYIAFIAEPTVAKLDYLGLDSTGPPLGPPDSVRDLGRSDGAEGGSIDLILRSSVAEFPVRSELGRRSLPGPSAAPPACDRARSR